MAVPERRSRLTCKAFLGALAAQPKCSEKELDAKLRPHFPKHCEHLSSGKCPNPLTTAWNRITDKIRRAGADGLAFSKEFSLQSFVALPEDIRRLHEADCKLACEHSSERDAFLWGMSKPNQSQRQPIQKLVK